MYGLMYVYRRVLSSVRTSRCPTFRSVRGFAIASRNAGDSHIRRLHFKRMYTATFTFAKGQYDDEFYALDNVIAQIAKSIPGYLGEEAWENHETGLVSNVYYWESMEALQALMKHPSHIQAKQRQSRWLNGYQVVIAQVIGTYGDGGITHPLAGKASPPGG